jgi:hypothetical protein
VSPYKLFLTWGWNNLFMREMLENIDLAQEWLKSVKANFLVIDKNIIDEITYIKNDFLKDKTNVNLLSQVICAKEIIAIKKDPVAEVLKKVVKKIEK